jgi:hypothetical protein
MLALRYHILDSVKYRLTIEGDVIFSLSQEKHREEMVFFKIREVYK